MKTKKIPSVLSRDELGRFLYVLESSGKFHLEALMKTQLFTGNRVQQTLSLRYADLNLSEGVILVKAQKRGYPVLKPIPKQLSVLLTLYCAKYQFEPGEYIFSVGYSGIRIPKPVNTHVFNYHLKRYFKLAGIPPEKAHSHVLRHTYLSMIYNKTRDLALVKKLAGHSSIESSAVYIHTALDYERLVVDNVFGGRVCMTGLRNTFQDPISSVLGYSIKTMEGI